MAQIYNEQRVIGIRVVPDGTTMYLGRPTIGIRDASGAMFGNFLRTIGVADLPADQAIYNDHPVLGAVVIYDNRTMYNGSLVLPAYAVSGAPFGPTALFLNNEPGAWYDPSDLSTLYQDAAGTVPVTAAGQTIGLVLDKSKGLVLGNELVTNGGFDSGTGWTLGPGWSISGGSASKSAGTAAGIEQPITISAGKTYQVTYTATVVSGGMNIAFYGGTPVAGPIQTTPGTYTVRLVALTGNNIVSFIGNAAFTGTIDNISVRELPGNHATQATAASKPLLQQDATGRYYLLFDGTDDFLVTNTIAPGTDKAQVFAGVRKLSDAARGLLLETGNAQASSIRIEAPPAIVDGRYRFSSYGTLESLATTNAGYTSPITNVLTGIGDIAADTSILRANGSQVASSTADQGTGNFLAYPLYIGRRAGTTLPFNGRLYGLITRFGPNLSDAQIAQAESWLNQRTGAY